MVVRNMDKIISLMITAVMTVTSCSFKGENPLDGKRIALLVTVSVTALIGKAVTAS